jgi:triacylglycerol lipase
MKLINKALLLTSGLLLSSAVMAASYQACSTSGCRTAGSAWVLSSYAKTKYPVILAHGMGGFSSIAGIEYFYGIGSNLTQNGAQVFETQVASFDSSYVRGEQLECVEKTV